MRRKIFIADATELWLPAEVVYDDSGREIIKIAQRSPVRLSNLPADYCFLLQVTTTAPPAVAKRFMTNSIYSKRTITSTHMSSTTSAK
jgi:hypothetical protein